MAKYYTPKRPAIGFANSGSAMQKIAIQRVEPVLQYVSDHATRQEHFAGVLRYPRDFRDYLFSYRFPPFPADANPNTAPPATPTLVALTGSNFVSGAQIFVVDNGTTFSTTSTFIDTNRMTFISPMPPDQVERSVTITVVNPNHGLSASNDSIFAYENSPILLDISSSLPTSTFPATASFIQGETPVGLDGFYFKRGSAVRVSSGAFSVVGTEVVWNSSNSLSVLAPSVSSTGVYDLVVRSPSGLESNALQLNYIYHYPVLSSLIPNTCSVDGGDTVYAYGSYFLSGAIVNLAGADQATYWSNQALLTFSSPSHGAGTANVEVKNPDGQTSSFLTILYVVGLPKVYTITPSVGSSGSVFQVSGKTLSSSDGSGLVTSMWLGSSSFQGATYNIPEFTVVNSGSASFVMPLASTGTYVLYVSSSAGVGFNVNALVSYVMLPSISSMVPATGGLAGNFFIDVYGANFLPATGSVWTLDGSPVSSSYVDPSHYQVFMPAHAAGTVTLTCTNNGQYTASATFTYVTASSIMSGGIWVPSV